MQSHAVPSRQARKYAPRGVAKEMFGVRFMPEEKQAIAALAQEEARTASSMVRLLALKGLEQYNNPPQRTH